jgi:hypothetical protein
MPALVFRTHADDLHLVARAQRRDRSLSDALRQKRELQRTLQMGVPAHRLLFGIVSVGNDLVLNPRLAFLIDRLLCHWPNVVTNSTAAKSR